jgi:hypothetical protein
MKNRKTLHEEISRVRVLMEVQLLTESKYKGVADVLLSLGDEMAELVAKHSDEFLRLRNAVTDKEAVKVLSELVNLEKRFADEILPRIFGVLDDNYQAEINAATNRLIDFKKNNLLINDETIGDQLGALNGLFNQWPGIDKIIKKQIKDVLDGVQRNPITIPSKNIVDNRLTKDLQDTFKKWDEIAPGVLSIADKKLMGLGPFRGLRAKLKYTITNLLNTLPPIQKKSMERIVGYLKEASDKLINDAEIPKELYRLIDTEIEALRKSESFAKNEIYNLIQREVNKATGTDKGFSIVSALKENDALGKNAESYFKSLLDDNPMVDEISDLFGWVPGGMMKKENIVRATTSAVKLLQRVFGMVTAGYATNISSIYRSFLLKHGVVKGTWWLYLYFQGVSKIVWPTIYGMYEYFKNSLVTQETQFEETEESLSFFIQEEFKKAMGIYNVEFIKLFGTEIPTFELDIIKTINPFTNVWAKLMEASDYWITQGGLREWTLESVENAGGNTEEAGRQLDSIYQVQQARFDSLLDRANQERADYLRTLDLQIPPQGPNIIRNTDLGGN